MKPCTTHVRKERDKWIYENVLIRKARVSDAKILAPHLRKADKAEIKALLGLSPEIVLEASIRDSAKTYSVTSLDGKEIYAIFGVATANATSGMIWLLGSEAMFKAARVSFIRNSKFWVDKLMENYEILFNVVDCRNKKHIRWLKWIGFTFAEAPLGKFGVEKRPFYQFYMHKGDLYND